MNNRIFITGVGMVTPIGIGRDAFQNSLFNGYCGIRDIQSFDTSRFSSKLGAEITDFNPKEFITSSNLRRMDCISRLAVASMRMALDDADFTVDASNRDVSGIVMGIAFGSTDIAAQFGRTIFTEGPNFVNPISVPNTVINAPAGHGALEFKLRGINATLNHREASAETALAYAASQIRFGRSSMVLCGGADILSEFFFEVLTHFKTLSPLDTLKEGCFPYDGRRNGIVVGEGAGIVCLEPHSRVQSRDCEPYCEILGWGMSSVPTASPTDWPINPYGAVKAMQNALTSAGLAPDQIDFILGSANGSKNLDQMEIDAVMQVFGDCKKQPYITSIKGALGESFSSGGIRAAAMAMALKHDTIPPTIGLHEPIMPFPFVRKRLQTPIHFGMLNGFSSGGTFVSIVFGK